MTDGVNPTEFTVNFTVIANEPPVWHVSMPTSVIGIEDQPIDQIGVLAIDPEGKGVTYSLVSAPAWIEFDGMAITGTPGFADIGSALITVSASDGMMSVDHEIDVTVNPYYGDATKDGSISALDASMVLQHKVKKVAEIDFHATNVTREKGTDPIAPSAWDAAHILYKIVMPGYIFPVQGGETLSKPVRKTEATLAWVQSASDWILKASGGFGPVGTDLVLELPQDATISSEASFAYERNGDLVTIGVAAVGSEAELLRISGLTGAPEVVSVMLNNTPAMIAEPLSFQLRQNAPNPFNPSTTIAFTVPEAAPVTLSIYDANGRLVRTLLKGEREAGFHEIVWDGLDNSGRAVASGMYLYRLTAGDNTAARKLLLVR
ncbi:MAG TPA: T9SS type A sorting domain-containing protein [Firmicutes bacterium]|nr:T9SS type A sorting domain-containing protein [Bacillota bacterium]